MTLTQRTFKRLDPWWNAPDFIGCYVKSDQYNYEGVVIGGNVFDVMLDTMPTGVMTSPWHTDSKWWVDIESLPNSFLEFDQILEDDPDHPGLTSQDEWGNNPRKNQQLIDDYDNLRLLYILQ